jgi:aldehyde:ferredoxin oxidoreductase
MVDIPHASGAATLTDKEIATYQRLFKAEFGIELTKDQALEKGLRLVRLLRVVMKDDSKKH